MTVKIPDDYNMCEESLRGYEKAIHDLKNFRVWQAPRKDGLVNQELIISHLNKRLTCLENIHEEQEAHEREQKLRRDAFIDDTF